MNLTDIYRRLSCSKITLADAASEFGVSVRSLRIRIAKLGDRMPLLLLTLDRIVADAINRNEAARILGITPRQVNKLMESWSVQRPPAKEYLVDREASALKWDMRKKFAIEYIAGNETLGNAAVGAGISTRQMRRWISDLLAEHHGIVFKDLQRIPKATRGRFAQQIIADEKLDPESQKTLQKIVMGNLSLKDEAIARVLAKSKKRRFREVAEVSIERKKITHQSVKETSGQT